MSGKEKFSIFRLKLFCIIRGSKTKVRWRPHPVRRLARIKEASPCHFLWSIAVFQIISARVSQIFFTGVPVEGLIISIFLGIFGCRSISGISSFPITGDRFFGASPSNATTTRTTPSSGRMSGFHNPGMHN